MMKIWIALVAFILLMAAPQHAEACEGIETNVAGIPTCLKPGDTFKDCPDCPDVVLLPGGTFFMGTSVIIGPETDNWPAHEVKIARPFAVGKFEITRGQYRAFAEASGFDDTKYWKDCTTLDIAGFGKAKGKTWKDTGFAQTELHPVVCVSWEAATKYAAWLSKKTGETYRLLTEAEWEYAGRAGNDEPWTADFSKELYCGHMNLADKTAALEPVIKTNFTRYKANHHNCGDDFAFTAPVGSYKPNGFGLHDMHGNAFEWVQDCYVARYRDAPIDGSARKGPVGCKRITRGGGWFWESRYQSLDYRRPAPGNNADDRGFRIARDVKTGWW